MYRAKISSLRIVHFQEKVDKCKNFLFVIYYLASRGIIVTHFVWRNINSPSIWRWPCEVEINQSFYFLRRNSNKELSQNKHSNVFHFCLTVSDLKKMLDSSSRRTKREMLMWNCAVILIEENRVFSIQAEIRIGWKIHRL